MEKLCKKCNNIKNIDQFRSCPSTKDKKRNECRECHNKSNVVWNGNNTESKRASSKEYGKKREAQIKDKFLLRKFGITLEEYNKKSEEQNHKCAICNKKETSKHQSGTVRRLAVDHCHITGKVRKLLCRKCNMGIGQFGDSIQIITKALKYLKEHKNEQV